MALAIHIIFICLFIFLGILFSLGKGAGLIAGYNTASSEEKAQYDEKKLCRYMGKFMFSLAAGWCIIASSAIFKLRFLFWIGSGVIIILLIVGVIYANIGNKLRK